MRVLYDGNVTVYVYSEGGQPHKMPHCHVRSPDNTTIIAIPSLERIIGPPLSKPVRKLLIDSLDKICDCWNELNPEETT